MFGDRLGEPPLCDRENASWIGNLGVHESPRRELTGSDSEQNSWMGLGAAGPPEVTPLLDVRGDEGTALRHFPKRG